MRLHAKQNFYSEIWNYLFTSNDRFRLFFVFFFFDCFHFPMNFFYWIVIVNFVIVVKLLTLQHSRIRAFNFDTKFLFRFLWIKQHEFTEIIINMVVAVNNNNKESTQMQVCVWVWIRKKRPSSSILCVHVGFYTESAFLFGNVEFLFCLYFIFSLNPSSETPYIQITFTHTRPIYNMQAHQHCAILFYILFIFKCACICATRAIFLRT